jgi:flagellar basal-body rod protein FlgB
MDDLTIGTVHAALRGVVTRQRVIANNLANVETPGFTAQKVTFEDSLRAAMAASAPGLARVKVEDSDAAANLNGNNVQIDDETMSLIDAGLQHQLLIEALNHEFGLLRTAIGRTA